MEKNTQSPRPIKLMPESFNRVLPLKEETKLAEKLPVFWWCKCLKASDEYSAYSRFKNNPEIADTYNHFGDIHKTHFANWWMKTGRKLFTLQKPLRDVKRITARNESQSRYPESDTVLIEIPLTMRKQTAIRKIKEILNDAYKDREVDIQKESTAIIKYKKSKIRMATIDLLLHIRRIRKRHPKKTLFEIGNIAGVELDYFARSTDIDETLDDAYERRRMTIAVSRYLKQADNLLHNAARGIFPSLKSPTKSTDLSS